MMKWGDEVRLGQSLDGRDEGRNEVMGFKIAGPPVRATALQDAEVDR
jgi:hypothetical protein